MFTSSSLVKVVALAATLSQFLVSTVDAHGYVTSPPSRPALCKYGQVKDCGEIQYEPQSIEKPKGLPFSGRADGHLCSAGLPQFAELDRQGKGVWPTTQAANVHSFDWKFTAEHATTDFKYYITKADWDSSTTSGLSASDFESEPFLTVPMGGKAPPATMSHDLSSHMPSRSGYHVVYAVWTVDNTANAFYNCIDLDFGGGSGGASGTSSNATSPNSNGHGAGSNTPSSAAGSGSGSHAANGSSCSMKRRDSNSGIAARGDYHRQKMQLQRKRQA